VIDHVADGDTVALRNGQRVRLVQVDTPEVYFGTECYGPQASATTKRLLPAGTLVRLFTEPATDSMIITTGYSAHVQLVRVGTAAPYSPEVTDDAAARSKDA
jgi:endonuclease YncB( thermonuclease family)